MGHNGDTKLLMMKNWRGPARKEISFGGDDGRTAATHQSKSKKQWGKSWRRVVPHQLLLVTLGAFHSFAILNLRWQMLQHGAWLEDLPYYLEFWIGNTCRILISFATENIPSAPISIAWGDCVAKKLHASQIAASRQIQIWPVGHPRSAVTSQTQAAAAPMRACMRAASTLKDPTPAANLVAPWRKRNSR